MENACIKCGILETASLKEGGCIPSTHHKLACRSAEWAPTTISLDSHPIIASTRSLIIIKKWSLVTKAMAHLELYGEIETAFTILASDQALSRHYAGIRDKPYYESAKLQMSDDKMMVIVFKGPPEIYDTIRYVRSFIGPTDPKQGDKQIHMRALYCDEISDNGFHASDSIINFQREMTIWLGELTIAAADRVVRLANGEDEDSDEDYDDMCDDGGKSSFLFLNLKVLPPRPAYFLAFPTEF
jgi:nucleoside diphosphate kinase